MIPVCFNISQDLPTGTPGDNQENGTALMVSNLADIQVVSSKYEGCSKKDRTY